MAASVSLQVEFGGGAELLFDGVKKHQVTLPCQPEPWDIRNLLRWIRQNLLKERPELFMQGESVVSWIINSRTRIMFFSSRRYMVGKLVEKQEDVNPDPWAKKMQTKK
ncbi:ubiquitin-related modifier 1 isoform X2 [Indicator indicator]|uniref:ubiquitin-related modifier 1 isoform X2 n=1 Tax=Indicator indicator TaxID=1002788 RepID=UPI0023DFBDE4|nr:ubiquitin-related modifier 1 isoform X2 [Indicator indicator]